MRKDILAGLAVGLIILWMNGIAHSTILHFTYSGASFSGSGEVNVIDNHDGTFTAIKGYTTAFLKNSSDQKTDYGTFFLVGNKNSPTTYLASPLGLFVYDNILYYSKNPLLNNWGLLFSNANGTIELNILGNGAGYPYSASLGKSGEYIKNKDVIFNVTPVK
jgi:hypothetical protein